LHQLNLDVITFIPAGAPWQKAGIDVGDPEHRWTMTRRAVDGAEGFEADDREVRRPGWSYTADTLETFPHDEELILVLGADAAAGILSWHRPDTVLARAAIAVMPRPGVERKAVEIAVGDPAWLDTPEIPISGTMLRDRRRRGLGIRYLVPNSVHDYIMDNDLYAP
jgi:nicotinate-nucleotide adenylyltransferase